MEIKTLQEWIEWAEEIENTADESDDSQYEKRLVDIDDLLKHFKEYKPSGSSYIDMGIMEFIDKLKEELTKSQS